MKKYIMLFAVFLLVSTPVALAAVSLIDEFPTISDVKVGPVPATQPAPTTQPAPVFPGLTPWDCVAKCMDEDGATFDGCMDSCEDKISPAR